MTFKLTDERLASFKHWQKIGMRQHHGVNCPLFYLKTRSSCGIGEYSDLIPLINWVKSLGMDCIQLLPLNDTGTDPSPYNAISALALNPIHISLTRLPRWQELEPLVQELQALNDKALIDYAVVREKKEAFLKAYFELQGRPKLPAEDWLKAYAKYKGGDPNYHIFVQNLASEQLQEVHDYAKKQGVFLKGDIPILISPKSVDVQNHPELFLKGYSAGAPPDVYAEEGQNWGFPLYNWKAMEEDGYSWWKKRLEEAAKYYDIYRIDHIVGFYRIWAIAEGLDAKDGSFLPFDPSSWIEGGEKIMHMMLQATSMLPIGEDLGVVPSEVRENLHQLGISGTKVMRWERLWDTGGAFIPIKSYPKLSMTCVSTHDSEPLDIWWQSEEAKAYAKEKSLPFGSPLTKELRLKILKESHQSASYFHINLLQEYLSLDPALVWENERINVPGTVGSQNWSCRMREPLETVAKSTSLRQAIKSLL